MPFRSWLLMLVAIAATLVLALPGVRYASLQVVEPSLLDQGMRRLGDPAVDALPGGFLLKAADAENTRGLEWSVPVIDAAVAVRVQADVVLLDVGEGEKRWHRAMISVRMLDAQKKASERVAFMGSGSQAMAVDTLILLVPDTAALQVMARLLRVPGEFSVSALRLSWLSERPWVPVAMLALSVVWLLAFAGLLIHWLHAARYRAALALVFVAVLAAVAMPGEWRDALQQWVSVWLADLLGGPLPMLSGGGLSDYVHFAMFAALGGALALARRDLRAGWLLAELVLLAVATEVVQTLVPGREAGWLDIGLDAAGGLLGVLLVRLLRTSR